MSRTPLLLFFFLATGLFAQKASDPNLGQQLSLDQSAPPGTWKLRWWGASGHNYLIRTSTDLVNWSLVPAYNPSGADAVLELNYAATTTSRYFFQIVDLNPGASGAPSDDSNGNGLSDAWEIYYFGHLGVDPNANPSGDGLTNLQHFLAGTSPIAPNPAPGITLDLPTSSELIALP